MEKREEKKRECKVKQSEGRREGAEMDEAERGRALRFGYRGQQERNNII
jgi:hypothetical protein